MSITKATKDNGFLSQREFSKYMKDFDENIEVAEQFESQISRRMMAYNREKGERGEFIVMGKLRDMGYEVEPIGGNNSCDLIMNTDKGWKRIEVKTAAQGPDSRSNNFKFSDIKPWKYDILALVFVGYDGLSVKIGGNQGKHFIKTYGTLTDRGAEGSYGIALDRYRGHTGMYGTERMIELNEVNVKKVLADT